MFDKKNDITADGKGYSPEERVAKMNGVFDRLVLPILIFTLAIFIIFGIIPKISCAPKDEGLIPDSMADNLDPYLLRETLLDDMENNLSIFQNGGYTIVDYEATGYAAYCEPAENIQILDNLADVNGNVYSAVVREGDGLTVTVKIYSRSILLVIAEGGGQRVSAIFDNDRFDIGTASGSDLSDAQAVLSMVSAQELTELVDIYKQTILSLVE